MTKKRIANLRRQLAAQGLDGLLVTLPFNRRYLSGFVPDDGQWGESSGSLLITRSDAILLTDFRYAISAEAQAPLFTTRIYRRGLAKELPQILEGSHVKRLGFEADGILVLQHMRLEKELDGLVELVPTEDLVSPLRRVKDRHEIDALRKSLSLMEKVLAEVLAGDLAGRTERSLALEIVRAVEDAGAEGSAFDPIVASGPNGAEPHAEPGERVIAPGDPIIFDVGARLDGYRSDISRSVVAGGPDMADERFRQVYSTVKKAQDRAIREIKPGMTGQEADAIARQVIEDAGFGEHFGHALGHGVGLATHEAPSVSPLSDETLEPGMVFTVEPGIYLPGWGGVRLEQMVELGSQGCVLLNRLDDFYEFP